MSRAVRWGLTLLLGAVLVGIALGWRNYLLPTRLPPHLAHYSATWPGENNVIRDELRALGSNAVPALVANLNSRSWADVPWIQRVRDKLPSSWADFLPNDNAFQWRRQSTLWVLGELGSNALPAIPTLELYRDGATHHEHRTATVIALAKIQPNDSQARSNLADLLLNGGQGERFWVAWEFGAVPVRTSEDLAPLLSALSDTDQEVQANATISVARFGPLAAPAVPRLRQLLTNDYKHAPVGAAYALASIGRDYVPETLVVMTNAIVKQLQFADYIAPLYFKAAGTSAARALPFLTTLSERNPGGWADRAVVLVSPHPTEKAIRRLGDLVELEPSDIELLGSLGAAAQPVVRRLQRIAEQSPYATLRAAARRAVERIQAKSKPE
ncbi:MAG: hypothetical protein J0M24_14690 [Verrucomicrobia bacterium]|nr:hypothetical protein [Verrucomicrobiota bacterium]